MFMEAFRGVILLAMTVGILAATLSAGWLLFWGGALFFALAYHGVELLVMKIRRLLE